MSTKIGTIASFLVGCMLHDEWERLAAFLRWLAGF